MPRPYRNIGNGHRHARQCGNGRSGARQSLADAPTCVLFRAKIVLILQSIGKGGGVRRAGHAAAKSCRRPYRNINNGHRNARQCGNGRSGARQSFADAPTLIERRKTLRSIRRRPRLRHRFNYEICGLVSWWLRKKRTGKPRPYKIIIYSVNIPVSWWLKN
jgi:hypothetical protein